MGDVRHRTAWEGRTTGATWGSGTAWEGRPTGGLRGLAYGVPLWVAVFVKGGFGRLVELLGR